MPYNGAGTLRIAIIGGGFTGTAAAIALLRHLPGPALIHIFEATGQLGGGIAYGAAAPCHLLNVRAKDITLDSGRQGDFLKWLRQHHDKTDGGGSDIEAHSDFLPRLILCRYAQDRFGKAVQMRPDIATSCIAGTAEIVSKTPNGYKITVTQRQVFEADIIVLATGYQRNRGRRAGRHSGPYDPMDPELARRARHALLLGTGLSMIDAYIALREAGFGGMVRAVSRRGLLPRPHGSAEPAAVDILTEIPTRAPLRTQFHSLRQVLATAQANGRSWQPIFDSLRRDAMQRWQDLPPEDQRRFRRHLQTLWDVHRHRVPAHIAQRLEQDIAAGRLVVERHRIVDANLEHGRVWLQPVRGASNKPVEMSADILIDCRGHRPDVDNAAVRSLRRDGSLHLDRLGLGIAVNPAGQVIDGHGWPSPKIFALGPLGLGSLFEITGIPEIVEQCDRAAATISSHWSGQGQGNRGT